MRRSKKEPEASKESQTQWGIVVEVKPTRVKSRWLLSRDFRFENSPLQGSRYYSQKQGD